MQDYLDEIEHSVAAIVPLIWDERDSVSKLEDTVSCLAEAVEREYQEVEILANDYEDDDGIATMRYWDNLLWSRGASWKNQELDAAKQNVAAHRFSVASLSAS